MSQVSYGTITITDTTDIERIYPIYCKGNLTNAPSISGATNWNNWKELISQAGGTGDYIWQRIVTKKVGVEITYSNASQYCSDAVRLTGEAGVSPNPLTISSTQYAQTQNENDTPSYGNSMPSSINEGWWLWVKVNYSDGNSTVTKIKQGQKGDIGISVTGTKEIYFLKRTTDSVPTAPGDGVTTTSTSTAGGVWTTVVPDYVAGGVYYTSIQTSYSSGTSPKSSPAVINQGLTDANAKALDAYNTSTARDTEINAIKAQAKYYWWDSEGAHVAAGLTNIDSDSNINHLQPSSFGFNSLMSPGALKLRYKDINFAQLATNSLTFYRPATNGSTYVQGKKGMDLTADALTFYEPLAYNSSSEPTAAAQLTSNGLKISDGIIQLGTNDSSSTSNGCITLSNTDFIRLINGTSRSNLRLAIGQYFGVKNDGTLYASNADISGKITASDGQIGPWFINSTSISRNANGNAAGSYNTASNLYFGTSGISLSTVFKVDSSGKLTATGVDITGEIKADTGRIGGTSGWTIASQQIYSTGKTIGNDDSMFLSTKNLAGTVAGTTLTTTAPSWRLTVGSNFGVDNTGKLYASNGKFNGRIEATEGYIANSVTIGNGGTALSTIETNAKQSQVYTIGVNNGTTGYHFLGTLTLSSQTAEAEIEIHTGNGQNNEAYQNLTIRANIKRGYQPTTAATAGITVRYEGDPTIVTMGESNCSIIARCTEVGVLNIYMYTPNWGYADGWYQVKGRDWTWVHQGTILTTAPSEGTAQAISSMNPYTTATNYITNIDSNKGITVKPQDSSGNDFLQMNSTAIEFFRNSTTTSVMRLTDNNFRLGLEAANHTTIDTNGLHIWAGTESTATNEIALFSSTARIGRTNNSRFLINAGSLQAYNSSNAEYFEVSSTNLSFANNYGYLFKINKKANDTIDMQLATPSTNETNGYDVFKVSTRLANQTSGIYYFPYPYTLGTTVNWFLPPGFKFNDWIQVYNVQGEIITSYATYTTSTWAGMVKISLTLSTSYSGPIPQEAHIAYIVPASSNLLTGTGALYNWQVPFTIGNGSTDENGELATSHNAMIVDIYGNILSSGMAGQIIMYAGERAPIGWLLCQGQAVSRTTYATLFAVIGTTYGTGNGSTTFNLPDFRGRVGVGVGTGTATGATAHTLNQKAGEETHVLTPGETAMKQHEHDLKYNVVEWKNGTTSTNKSCRNIVASGTGTTTTEKTTAANGSAHNNMQPYIGINYIICTGETDYSKLVD